MDEILFTKMQGLGNDFILIKDLEKKYNDEKYLAEKLCNRHFGIGADGVIFVRKSFVASIEMVIYNADGSYASMCGNGIRCFAKYVWDNNIVKENPMKIETGDGIKEAILTLDEGSIVEKVTINMGNESYAPKDIPATVQDEIINKDININGKTYEISSLRMGVPHTVVVGNLDEINVGEGKYIENYSFFPQGTNVNFCQVINREYIKVKTWERGAGATLACGTGSCASFLVARKLGYVNDRVCVEVPGGEMEIEKKADGVYMTGAARNVFIGKVPPLSHNEL